MINPNQVPDQFQQKKQYQLGSSTPMPQMYPVQAQFHQPTNYLQSQNPELQAQVYPQHQHLITQQSQVPFHHSTHQQLGPPQQPGQHHTPELYQSQRQYQQPIQFQPATNQTAQYVNYNQSMPQYQDANQNSPQARSQNSNKVKQELSRVLAKYGVRGVAKLPWRDLHNMITARNINELEIEEWCREWMQNQIERSGAIANITTHTHPLPQPNAPIPNTATHTSPLPQPELTFPTTTPHNTTHFYALSSPERVVPGTPTADDEQPGDEERFASALDALFKNLSANRIDAEKIEVKRIDAGNIKANLLTCTKLNELSDIRTKKYIRKIPTTDALKLVRQMESYVYEYKSMFGGDGREELGFLAQKLTSCCKQLTQQQENGLWTIKPTGILALVLGALNEIADRHDRLSEQFSNLNLKPNLPTAGDTKAEFEDRKEHGSPFVAKEMPTLRKEMPIIKSNTTTGEEPVNKLSRCTFSFTGLKSKQLSMCSGYETTWEWLKGSSKEKRTSAGLPNGARYFKTDGPGPELFGVYDGAVYFHDKDQWQKYKSGKIIYIGVPITAWATKIT